MHLQNYDPTGCYVLVVELFPVAPSTVTRNANGQIANGYNFLAHRADGSGTYVTACIQGFSGTGSNRR